MKTLLRIGLACGILSIMGLALIWLFDAHRKDARAADSRVFSIPVRHASVPATTPTATNVAQVLLKVKVIDLDREKLRKAGVDLLDITSEKEQLVRPYEVSDQPVHVSSLSQRESELIAQLLKASGAGKTLAEPTIVTNFGRPARFHTGGEFPILVPQAQGATSIEYRQFGTSINFVPQQLPGNKLRLEIRIENSELDHAKAVDVNGSKVPGLRNRWLDTGVEVEVGKTVLIYGDPGQAMLVMVTPEIIAPLPAAAANQPPQPQRLPAVQALPRNAQLEVALLAGNSMVLAFPHKVPRLAVAHEEIIKAQPTAPDKVQIHAEQAGVTTLTAWNENAEVQEIRIIVAERQAPVEIQGDARYTSEEPATVASLPPAPAARVSMTALLYEVDAQLDIDVQRMLNVPQAAPESDDAAVKSPPKSDIQGVVSVLTARALASVSKQLSTTKGVKLLSRPQVMTLAGKPASVKVTTPVRIAPTEEVQPASSESQVTGVRVDLVPIVLGSQRVRLSARTIQTDGVSTLHDPRSKTVYGAGELFAGETLALMEESDDDRRLLLFVTPTVLPASNAVSTATQRLSGSAPEFAQPLSSVEDVEITALNAEQRLRHLKGRFGEHHPSVMRLKREIEALEQQQALQQQEQQQQKDRDRAEFEQLAHEMFPNAELRLRSLAQGVILSGTVADAEDARVLTAIAEEMFPRVINNLRVADVSASQVTKPVEPLHDVLKELFPGASINVRPLNNSVVLSGTADRDAVQSIIRVAEDYYPQVITHLRDSGSGNSTTDNSTTDNSTTDNSTTDNSTTDNSANADPANAGPSQPAEPASTTPALLDEEIRELRDDVRGLRRDVSHLIELLESDERGARPEIEEEAAKDQDEHSALPSSKQPDVWKLVGVRLKPIKVKTSRYRGGLSILEVRKGGPASAEGMREGDVLVGVGKWETVDEQGLSFALKNATPDSKGQVKFYLLRGSQTLFGRLRLEAREQSPPAEEDTGTTEKRSLQATAEIVLREADTESRPAVATKPAAATEAQPTSHTLRIAPEAVAQLQQGSAFQESVPEKQRRLRRFRIIVGPEGESPRIDQPVVPGDTTHGWMPNEHGGLDYLVQLRPEQLEAAASGASIECQVHPDIQSMQRIFVFVGANPLPRELPR